MGTVSPARAPAGDASVAAMAFDERKDVAVAQKSSYLESATL